MWPPDELRWLEEGVMKANQVPGKVRTGTTTAKPGHRWSGTLAIAACLALAGTSAAAPAASASTGQVSQPAHARIADPAQSLVWGRSRSHTAQRGSFGSALVGSAPVQPGPSAVAVDLATNTIYTANGNNANGPTNPGGDTVSVIDGRRCDARDVSRCKGPWPTVKVGNLPSSIAVDQATDTVYVTILGSNTAAVFNGATCNGQVTAGCGQAPIHVRVGSGPFGIFADDANHTVYVGNPGPAFNEDTMSMINSRTCNGSDLAGCARQKPAAVPVAVGLDDFDVNQATHTAYVATGTGVAAFDTSTCNATVLTGCGHIGMLKDPQAPENAVSVDSANNTIYATPFPLSGPSYTMSAFDGRACNAADLAGCAAEKPGTVTVAPQLGFEVTFGLVVDAPLHTVYVVNQKDDTLSAVNTDVCNGAHLGACATLQPPTIHTGEDPESVDVNTATQTLYTANQVSNDISVIDAARCNATITSGCRQPPPAITLTGPGASAADPAVATLYVATGTNTVAMINSRTCNASHHDGCTAAPPTVTMGAGPVGVAVNPRTHTVYVANHGSGKTGSVSVFNDLTCNATTSSGCKSARTLHVPGGNAAAVAVNPATDTIYVTTVPASGSTGGPGTVLVFNGAPCNATNTAGCGQLPASVTAGLGAGALAVNSMTDTIYVANYADSSDPDGGNTVSVINGAICNAADTTGCAQSPQTITLGPPDTSPDGIAIDQATDTVYVADLQDGEKSGTVSVINGATCNGTTGTGCGHTPPTVTAGFGPADIAFDPANRTVAVANIEDTSISVINGATCNATVTTSCHRTQPKFPAGRAPNAVTIDPAVGTIYVSNGDDTVSVIPG
jgi:DNA-binding beta-propeller fold protein YncE